MNIRATSNLFWQNLRLRRFLVGAGIGLSMSLLVVGLAASSWLVQWENYTYDARFRQRPVHQPGAKVVLVTIENSLIDYKTAPARYRKMLAHWGDIYGETITRLHAFGAAAIGLDIFHAVDDEELRGENRAFRAAILQAEGRVVLPRAFAKEENGKDIEITSPTKLETAASANAEGAEVTGYVNAYPDADGVMREFAPILRNPITGSPAPTFALVLARCVNPQTPAAPLVINYTGRRGTIPRIPLQALLEKGAENDPKLKDLFRGAVVIIGRTDARSNDFFLTPLDGELRMPGAEIHANVVATLLDGNAIRRAAPLSVSVGLLLLGMLLGGWVALAGPLRATLTTLAGVALWSAFCWWQLTQRDLWLPMVTPALTASLTLGGTLLWRQRIADRDLRLMDGYIDPAAQERLRRTGGRITRQERFDVTVMFTDIRAFTAWSQDKSPEEVVELINTMARLLTPLFFEHGGTFDKFMGDGLMAFFGAPEILPREEHARRAVHCAVAIEKAVAKSIELAMLFPGMQLRIGLHSGPAVVDILKAHRKKEYTAIGDTVNLASRIQDATKKYDAEIVLSETTFQAAGVQADSLVTESGYTPDGPYCYEPHNHDSVMVMALRKRTGATASAEEKKRCENTSLLR